MELSDFKNIVPGDVVIINWVDAALRTRINQEELVLPSNLLDESIAVGICKALDIKAISIIQNSNEETWDILTIPISLITQLKILKGGIEK
jgi:hypothetical protein